MVNIKIKIDGLDEFALGLKRQPQETIKELSKAVQKSVLQVHSQSLKEAPVNKQTGGGNLRQNIRSKMISKLSGAIEAWAPYSIFVHEGTKPHEIRTVNKKVLANSRTGQIFGKRVMHPGTRPNQFFIRAIERSRAKIEEFFATALKNVLDTLK